MILYTSWFSPFARKVATALELKGLPYEAVDGLARESRAALRQLNARVEVPVLVDDDGLVVVNSSDIVLYLEQRYPEPALYPGDVRERVVARALERLHDHRFDPIVVDCTLWTWADRDDTPPPGLLEAGQTDIDTCLAQLESALAARPGPWPFGAPGMLECAWWPSLAALKPLGFALDADRFPTVQAWLRAMRALPVFAADGKRTRAFMQTLASGTHERRRIFFSGDRLEWLLSRGFHDWFAGEVRAGRVAYPD
jgi:glutathione S-transferase